MTTNSVVPKVCYVVPPRERIVDLAQQTCTLLAESVMPDLNISEATYELTNLLMIAARVWANWLNAQSVLPDP